MYWCFLIFQYKDSGKPSQNERIWAGKEALFSDSLPSLNGYAPEKSRSFPLQEVNGYVAE